MTKSKKEWVTPELIVLVRSKPEEAVLAACKKSVSGSAGVNSSQRTCLHKNKSFCAVTICNAITST